MIGEMRSREKENDDVRNRREITRITLFDRDYLSVRPIIRWLQDTAVGYAKGVFLDFGCGNKPYYPIFKSSIEKYIGADVTQNLDQSVDILIGDDGILPLDNESVETVLSTQVLEHVKEPQRYLQELSRVLKPGGKLILTCPQSYMLHEEPYDYYRYTRYGVEYLLKKYQLQILQLDTAGGAWRLMGQIFLNHKIHGRKINIPIISGIFYYLWVILSNVIFSTLDKMNMNPKDTANYMIIAQKNQGSK
ncbi:MAG: class I SAM-dependent methyltransferase [Bacteroidota bacterium]